MINTALKAKTGGKKPGKFKAVFKAEWRRLLSARVLLIVSVLGMAAFLYGAAAIYRGMQEINSGSFLGLGYIEVEISQEPTREEQLASFKTQLDALKTKTFSKYADKLNNDLKISILEIYIGTGTIPSDYAPASVLQTGIPINTENPGAYERTGLALFLLHAAFIPIIIFSAIVALKLFVYDIQTGVIKHTLAAPIKRKDLFLGKLFFLLSYIGGLVLIALLMALIPGVKGFGDKIIIVTGGKAAVTPMWTVFLSRVLGLAVIGVLTAGLCAAAGVFTHKSFFGGIIFSVLFIFLMIVFAVLFSKATEVNDVAGAYMLGQYFPFTALHKFAFGFTQEYFLALAYHLAGAGVLFFVTSVYYRKADF